MYSFAKRICLGQDAVEYLGLGLQTVGLDTNIYYKACNNLIFCDVQLYPDAADPVRSYYTLEKCGESVDSEGLFYMERDFYEWCTLDSKM